MGEAILFRSMSGDSSGTDGKALFKVTTRNSCTITCTQGSKTYTKASTGYVEFSVGYGPWVLETTYNSTTFTKTINVLELKVFEITLDGYTYGISIDMDNGDPYAAVTYTGDAEGFTPLLVNTSDGSCNYGSWEDIITNFLGVKPCLYLNGARTDYLNPNDYSKKLDGSAADITSGSAGDVMVEFKRTWYKYARTGNILTFEVSDYDRSSDGFVSTAFISMDGTGTIKDYMYYGAYESSLAHSTLISLSNKKMCITSSNQVVSVSYSTLESKLDNKGTMYNFTDYSRYCYILGLLMLVSKNRRMSDLGSGVSNPSNVASIYVDSGTLNTYGLFAGFSATNRSVKCFGIENLWGNMENFCIGIGIYNGSIYTDDAAPYCKYNTTSFDGYQAYSNPSDFPFTGSEFTGIPTKMDVIHDGAMIIPNSLQSDSTIGWAISSTFFSNSTSKYFIKVSGFGLRYHYQTTTGNSLTTHIVAC